MAMKKLKAKHDAVLAPTPVENMPPNYYLESNRPYAEQAGQLFAERTAKMMQDSLGQEVSESAKQMYAKSGFDYYMNEWHRTGRDIEHQIRDDTIRIGGYLREDMIDARMSHYPEILKRRGKNDMLGLCEQAMFKENVGRGVETLRNMDVPYRAAAVAEMRQKNGEPANSLILQTIWKQEAAAEPVNVTESQQTANPQASAGRRLPSAGEDLLAQQQANPSNDYGDYGG